MRLAMWSGPRNLSTAMMYAFAQRKDCAVWDEPFYAAALTLTGDDHPMREEVIAAGPTDPAEVISRCLGPIPADRQVFYQKHMTQHMLPGIPVDWLRDVTNVFLIRHPMRVAASYAAKRENPTFHDLGFARQLELFDVVRGFGQDPVVIDSTDIRAAPRAALIALCDRLDLPFDDAMLSWPSGGHASDGVWAPHWYGAVHRSTGFAGAEGPVPALEGRLGDLARQALPMYEALKAVKLAV